MDVEQSLLAVREVYVNSMKRCKSNEEELKKIDEEIQDLLHVIELSNFNARDGYKLAKELQKARKERRRIKDEIELLAPLKELIFNQKPSEKSIGKVLGDIRNIKVKHQNRNYRFRVRSDLEGVIK